MLESAQICLNVYFRVITNVHEYGGGGLDENIILLNVLYSFVFRFGAAGISQFLQIDHSKIVDDFFMWQSIYIFQLRIHITNSVLQIREFLYWKAISICRKNVFFCSIKFIFIIKKKKKLNNAML